MFIDSPPSSPRRCSPERQGSCRGQYERQCVSPSASRRNKHLCASVQGSSFVPPVALMPAAPPLSLSQTTTTKNKFPLPLNKENGASPLRRHKSAASVVIDNNNNNHNKNYSTDNIHMKDDFLEKIDMKALALSPRGLPSSEKLQLNNKSMVEYFKRQDRSRSRRGMSSGLSLGLSDASAGVPPPPQQQQQQPPSTPTRTISKRGRRTIRSLPASAGGSILNSGIPYVIDVSSSSPKPPSKSSIAAAAAGSLSPSSRRKRSSCCPKSPSSCCPKSPSSRSNSVVRKNIELQKQCDDLTLAYNEQQHQLQTIRKAMSILSRTTTNGGRADLPLAADPADDEAIDSHLKETEHRSNLSPRNHHSKTKKNSFKSQSARSSPRKGLNIDQSCFKDIQITPLFDRTDHQRKQSQDYNKKTNHRAASVEQSSPTQAESDSSIDNTVCVASSSMMSLPLSSTHDDNDNAGDIHFQVTEHRSNLSPRSSRSKKLSFKSQSARSSVSKKSLEIADFKEIQITPLFNHQQRRQEHKPIEAVGMRRSGFIP